MKRFLAMLLACVLLMGGAMAEMGMTGAIPVEMAFAGPSTEFSMLTAFYCLANFMTYDEAATAAQLEAQGLTVAIQENYDKPMSDHSHTSAYTLATGQLPVRGEARNVAVIAIRGTGAGEWYSNFDFAGESGENCAYAENFYAASEAIYEKVKPVIAELDAPVVIVTGYSRGAACANLLGLMINADVDMQDVYVYTFATPTTIRGEAENDGNIFNLVNMNDMITRMPPQSYGFTRAGTDIELRDESFINTDMHMMFMAMLGVCPDIGSFYNDKHAIQTTGLAEDGVTMYQLFIAFADMMSGDQALMAQAQQLLMELGSCENDFSAFLPLFSSAMMSIEGSQHMPDVYVQLMMALMEQQ